MSKPNKVTYVLGIDPGFAKLGIAVLSLRLLRGKPVVTVELLKLLKTEKGSKKKMRDLRVTSDDQRRLAEMWAGFHAVADQFPLTAIAIEAFSPWGKGKGGGNAWKTAFAYGLGAAFGLHLNVPVMPFLPADLKRRFCGKNSGSKEDVQKGLTALTLGLPEALTKIKSVNDHEHVSDAAAHAFLALEEVQSLHRLWVGP